jgi:hypothetical protein
MQLTERKMAWWHSVPVDGHGEDGSNARLNIVHRREGGGRESTKRWRDEVDREKRGVVVTHNSLVGARTQQVVLSEDVR